MDDETLRVMLMVADANGHLPVWLVLEDYPDAIADISWRSRNSAQRIWPGVDSGIARPVDMSNKSTPS